MTNTILFMSADPTDTARLRLGQGMRDVRERLLLSKSASNYVFLCRTSMRPGDITQTLFETEPQFVHFSGHGTESGALCFENDQGETHAVTLDALGELFSLFSTTIKCVVLNACFSVHQARAIVRNIPFVVGMKKEIGDAAAIATEFIKKDQAGARDFATTHASIRIMRPRKEAFLQQRQEEWLIRTGSYLTLQDALDKIYAHIVADEGLPPHSYGSEWILVNQFASKFSFWRHVIAPFNWVEAGNRRSCHDIAPGWSLQPPSVTGLLPDTEWEITFDPAKIDAFAVLTNSDVLPNVFERNPKIHAALLDSDYLRRCKAADVVATHFKHILVFEEWADFGKKGAVFVDGKKTFVDDASILRKYHLR
jgi:hypothetical protein